LYLTITVCIIWHRCSSFAEPKRTKKQTVSFNRVSIIQLLLLNMYTKQTMYIYANGIKVLSAVMRNKVTLFICVLFYISRTTIPDRYPYFMQLVSPHDVLSRSRSTRGHNKFISSLAPAAAMESQTNCPLLL